MLARKTFLKSQRRMFSSKLLDNDVVVCGFARTPMGSMGGALSSLTAKDLGAHAIREAVKRSGIDKSLVEEAFMGNVVSSGIGQAPTRQAVIYAGLELDTPCTTVNKVCASGMKAVMFASLSLMSGYRSVCIAGGMESMSNVPYYLPKARDGFRLGHAQCLDGLIHDGLWDHYTNEHMGTIANECALKGKVDRKAQDQYAFMSYTRATEAWSSNAMSEEVAEVVIPGKRGKPDTVVTTDHIGDFNLEKMSALRSPFHADGTITAANSSKISDGAAAMVVTTGKVAREQNLTPLFRIRGFGDAAQEPVEFPSAPSLAVPRAIAHAGLEKSDIEYHEINEAFAAVTLLNANLLGLDVDRVNVHGGAVALGHPIGCSGARLLGTLYGVLKAKDATIGCASICNGGGGASAMIIERLN